MATVRIVHIPEIDIAMILAVIARPTHVAYVRMCVCKLCNVRCCAAMYCNARKFNVHVLYVYVSNVCMCGMVCKDARTYVCTYICMCVHIHNTYTHIYSYIHRNIVTCRCM